MVVFVDQMSELLDLALEKYHSLTEVQREELAAYIIPEVSEDAPLRFLYYYNILWPQGRSFWE